MCGREDPLPACFAGLTAVCGMMAAWLMTWPRLNVSLSLRTG